MQRVDKTQNIWTINLVEHKVTKGPKGLIEFLRSPVDFLGPPKGSENDERQL